MMPSKIKLVFAALVASNICSARAAERTKDLNLTYEGFLYGVNERRKSELNLPPATPEEQSDRGTGIDYMIKLSARSFAIATENKSSKRVTSVSFSFGAESVPELKQAADQFEVIANTAGVANGVKQRISAVDILTGLSREQYYSKLYGSIAISCISNPIFICKIARR